MFTRLIQILSILIILHCKQYYSICLLIIISEKYFMSPQISTTRSNSQLALLLTIFDFRQKGEVLSTNRTVGYSVQVIWVLLILFLNHPGRGSIELLIIGLFGSLNYFWKYPSYWINWIFYGSLGLSILLLDHPDYFWITRIISGLFILVLVTRRGSLGITQINSELLILFWIIHINFRIIISGLFILFQNHLATHIILAPLFVDQ